MAHPDELIVLLNFSNRDMTRDEKRDRAHWYLHIGLAVKMVGKGWALTTRPGEPFIFHKDGTRFDLMKMVDQLKTGEIDGTAWQKLLAENGLDQALPC